MLKPKVPVEEFEKFGFKPCRGIPKKNGCYYLCVARGVQMIFVSNRIYEIQDWNEDDGRIHAKPNCRYKDGRTALDITYDIIKADMLERVFP